MNRFFTLLTFLTCLTAAVVAAPVRAAADVGASSAGAPLLVVVETGPGAGCDADAVRAAIAAELHTAVVAPASSPAVALAGPRANTLLVSIDRERIVVTLRGRGDEDLTRSVAAPAERAARLRVVAWLAGNVARDQLSTFALPEASPSPSASEETPTPPPLVATPVVSTTAPSPFRESASAPAPIARATSPEPTREFPLWALSLGVGPARLVESGPSTTQAWSFGGQLEGHLHLGRWFVGLAIDVGPRAAHPFGGALLLGGQLAAGRLRLEASAGGGVEKYGSQIFTPGGLRSEEQAAAYGRVALAVSYPLVPDLDIVAQLTGHLTATTRPNPAFVAATFGLRLRMP